MPPPDQFEDDEDPQDASQVGFSQQLPELSQAMKPAKESEKANLVNLGGDRRRQAIQDLSRLLLFKALAGEPIDRLKCAKEALGEFSGERITSAVFDEAAANLRNVFGFELRRIPKSMENRKSFPSKFKDRLYVINPIPDDVSGAHSKAIHSVHPSSSAEKGLLMVILGFCFCKGDPDPDGSRWIWENDLYRLLHGVDENIPEEPPSAANNRKHSRSHTTRPRGGVSQTPDVDSLLDKFVKLDYLLKSTKEEAVSSSSTQTDLIKTIYSMGPRAAMEIGRKQVIYFCAEILDEEPDPTMLAEINEDADEAEE